MPALFTTTEKGWLPAVTEEPTGVGAPLVLSLIHISTTSGGPGQSDVLAFALNLEYLEATFYSYITQGADLPSDTTVSSGAITGAPAAKITFAGANAAVITDMLNEIYFDELNHVRELRSLLGILVVPRPAINLAALGAITAGNALSIARLFEDVGVTAYALSLIHI